MADENDPSTGLDQDSSFETEREVQSNREPAFYRTDGGTRPINVEVPDVPGIDDTDSDEAEIAYVNIHLPAELYTELLQLKEDHGVTWRGLLMRARRELDGYPTENQAMSQYELLQETRKRHGLTWKGMLLEGARHYCENIDPTTDHNNDTD